MKGSPTEGGILVENHEIYDDTILPVFLEGIHSASMQRMLIQKSCRFKEPYVLMTNNKMQKLTMKPTFSGIVFHYFPRTVTSPVHFRKEINKYSYKI